MRKYTYHIEHTYDDSQNVWTSADNEYEAEQNIRHDYHSIKSLTLIKVEDIESEDENPKTVKEEYVYVTKSGSVYHTSTSCSSLKARNPELTKITFKEARERGYKPCKRCK